MKILKKITDSAIQFVIGSYAVAFGNMLYEILKFIYEAEKIINKEKDDSKRNNNGKSEESSSIAA